MSSATGAVLSKCTICKKIPEEVALQCELNHAICRRCVRKSVEGKAETLKKSECTICQQITLKPELTEFTFVEPFKRFADILQFVTPDRGAFCQVKDGHEQEKPAEYHCSDCDIHLCESCIDAHIPTTRDAAKHRLFSIKEADSKIAVMRCSGCPDDATHYCLNQDCKKSLCGPCFRLGHEDHKVMPLNVAVRFLEESIEKHRAEMRRRGDSLRLRVGGIKSLKSDFGQEADRIIARVRDAANRMRSIIDRDEDELCQKITDIKDTSAAMFEAVLQDIDINVDRFELLEQIHCKLTESEPSPLRTVSAFGFITENDLTGGANKTDSVLSQLHAHQPYNWLYKPNPGNQAMLEELSNRKTNIFGEVCKRRTLEEVASLDITSETQAQVTGMATNDDEQIAISDRYTGVISLYGIGGHINHIHGVRVPSVVPNVQTEIQDVAFRPNGNLLVTNFPVGVVLEVTLTGKIVKQFCLNMPKSTWNPLGICINKRNEVAITFIGTCGVTSKKAFSIHTMDWDTFKVTKSRSLDFSPRYICPLDDGGYAVSDSISHSVYFLSAKLKRRFVYPGRAGLKCPSGLCCLPNGNVLITEKENCAVHEVSPSGNYRKVVLTERDGLRLPKAVTCTKNGDVIVADERGDLIKAYRYHSMGRLKIS
ncbi:uncharacterized protein LOC135491063 [Lineus longissimus]|uniref:uncharacterized protein LOC135491063 n=1 Tax=Lineus longissimus TaxID=88925 RepID=UPI00315D957F